MPVPSAISDLSQTAASNSPPGSESPTTADDYLRTHASFLALLRDGKGQAAEVSLASAATCDIGAANSMLVQITGTTTITSFGMTYSGPRFIRFAAALTLTHHATSLILPAGSNLFTGAGDSCIAIPHANGWRVVNYQRANEASLASSAGYQRMPSGMIVQWGSVALLSSTSDTTITFPIAFPNTCRSFVIAHAYTAGSGSIAYCAGGASSNAQAVARSTSSTLGANWVAIGV